MKNKETIPKVNPFVSEKYQIKPHFSIVSMSILFLLLFQIYAAENLSSKSKQLPDDSLIAMSEYFAYLMNIDISVVTKSKENIADAPGNVTVFTKDDINNYHYYTIAELANITPNFSTIPVWGEDVMITRGQKMNTFENGKHLLLINGIPANFNRNYKIADQMDLPLFFAKQVEFSRGPSSSLYGTGAFLGVINVVPDQLKENGNNFKFNVATGSRDHEKRVMSSNTFKSDNYEAVISANVYQKDASLAKIYKIDPDTKIGKYYSYYDDQMSKFIYASAKKKEGLLEGFEPGVIFIQKNDGLGESWYSNQTNQLNDITWTTFIPFCKYTKTLTDIISLNSYLKYSWGQEKGWHAPLRPEDFNGNGVVFAAYQCEERDFEGLAELSFQLNSNHKIISGVNYDMRKELPNKDGMTYVYNIQADSGNLLLDYNLGGGDYIKTIAGYLQYQGSFDVLAGLNPIIGFRVEQGSYKSNTYNHFSPRIGLVQKFTDNLICKGLYSSALRAPGIKDYGRNLEARQQGAIGLPNNLKPESIHSFDLSLVFTNKALLTSLTGYFNAVYNTLQSKNFESIITTVHVQGNYNIDSITSGYGVEYSLQYKVNDQLTGFGNASWSIMTDYNGNNFDDIPVAMGNLGANYTFPIPFNLNLSGVFRYISEYRVAKEGLPNPDGMKIFDLNLSSEFIKGHQLELIGRNIFDTEFKYPQNGVPLIPIQDASIMVSYTMNF
jgi:outer membrane receptor protein involved in Fe transport